MKKANKNVWKSLSSLKSANVRNLRTYQKTWVNREVFKNQIAMMEALLDLNRRIKK
jgi:hypothetical protein